MKQQPRSGPPLFCAVPPRLDTPFLPFVGQQLPCMPLVLHLAIPVGFALELDLDPDRGRSASAWWSWRGRTFEEARIGRA